MPLIRANFKPEIVRVKYILWVSDALFVGHIRLVQSKNANVSTHIVVLFGAVGSDVVGMFVQ